MKNLDLSKILFIEFKNRKSLLLGVIHKENWQLLGGGGGGQLPTYADLSGLGVAVLPNPALFFNSCTEDYSIHRLDHSLVKGSIITEMSIPWLLKILGDAIKQDVLLYTMLR